MKLLRVYLASLLSVLVLVGQATAAGRCDTTCQLDPSCSSGKCTLSKCIDTDYCYTYCFNCNGQTTCYASGAFCANGASTAKQLSFFTAFVISAGLAAAKYF